ncbi:MMPL family transporter [Methyloradius palustris]|nr:MMPL family transporter [Methyloradius palustris]
MLSTTLLKPARTAIVLWLVFILACIGIISRSSFSADLSAFLPRSPTAEQQLLMDQLRDGLVSRLILVGIEGTDEASRAKISKALAQQLRNDPSFVSVNNGEPVNTARDRAYLFNNRYLLSDTVTPERFSVSGLHAAIGDSVDLLASPAGLLVKSLLPHDPTGEMVQLLQQLDNGHHPQLLDGAWASQDGKTALLLLQTRASGSDTDAQKQAMQLIQQSFAHASTATSATLEMTGPGVFSVSARDSIKKQVRLIFVISSLLIALLLYLLYRSLTALLLGMLPVITGALAGIATVSLGFGVVHGITLGFGTALIGEAVDYSIYLFMQSEQGSRTEASRQHWVQQSWPTVRLGVLTSVFGFASLLISGFPGLAQLGLYAITGLLAAATMTRFVLPYLLPRDFRIHDVSRIDQWLSRQAKHATAFRAYVLILVLAACVIVYSHRAHLWNHELASLSPVSAADQALDKRLRSNLGAPDVRYLVVVSGDSQESVLQAAEQVSVPLQALVEQGQLASFESPARYLPSLSTQRARQASLPANEVLSARLAQAVEGLPVHADRFAPFLADVAAVREQALLQRADLEHTSMAMAADALLINKGQHWSALLPLTAPEGGEINADSIRSALSESAVAGALFVDLKAESNKLYSTYLNEAIVLSLLGLLAIIVLLLVVLRSPSRVGRIILPLAAAVITVTAGLALCGVQLIILHLIGLLLVVAIGSNYALFFDQADAIPKMAPCTFASLLFANIATVIGFGLLGFSTVPVLQAMGMTVAPGVILALIFSAIFARKNHAHTD